MKIKYTQIFLLFLFALDWFLADNKMQVCAFWGILFLYGIFVQLNRLNPPKE